MYLPKHFEQQDEAAVAQLLQLHPLATVAWQSAGLAIETAPAGAGTATMGGAHS